MIKCGHVSTNEASSLVVGNMFATWLVLVPWVTSFMTNIKITDGSTTTFISGRPFMGQTQSQYMSFGREQSKTGLAEAEASSQGARALVSGSNGMGQAQSQFSGAYDKDCTTECGQSHRLSTSSDGASTSDQWPFGLTRPGGSTFGGLGGIQGPDGRFSSTSQPIDGSSLISTGDKPQTSGFGAPGSSQYIPGTGIGPGGTFGQPYISGAGISQQPGQILGTMRGTGQIPGQTGDTTSQQGFATGQQTPSGAALSSSTPGTGLQQPGAAVGINGRVPGQAGRDTYSSGQYPQVAPGQQLDLSGATRHQLPWALDQKVTSFPGKPVVLEDSKRPGFSQTFNIIQTPYISPHTDSRNGTSPHFGVATNGYGTNLGNRTSLNISQITDGFPKKPGAPIISQGHVIGPTPGNVVSAPISLYVSNILSQPCQTGSCGDQDAGRPGYTQTDQVLPAGPPAQGLGVSQTQIGLPGQVTGQPGQTYIQPGQTYIQPGQISRPGAGQIYQPGAPHVSGQLPGQYQPPDGQIVPGTGLQGPPGQGVLAGQVPGAQLVPTQGQIYRQPGSLPGQTVQPGQISVPQGGQAAALPGQYAYFPGQPGAQHGQFYPSTGLPGQAQLPGQVGHLPGQPGYIPGLSQTFQPGGQFGTGTTMTGYLPGQTIQAPGAQFGQLQPPPGQISQIPGQVGLLPGLTGILPGQTIQTGQTSGPGGQFGQVQPSTGPPGQLQIPGQLPSQYGLLPGQGQTFGYPGQTQVPGTIQQGIAPGTQYGQIQPPTGPPGQVQISGQLPGLSGLLPGQIPLSIGQTTQPGVVPSGQYGQVQIPGGQFGQTPGQVGLMPGQSGLLPGQTLTSTGQIIQPGQLPGGQYGQAGLFGQVPGQVGLLPGQSGLLPGQVQPSTGQTIQPGQITGSQYGQTQLPTGQPGQVTGQAGLSPGQSGLLPGQVQPSTGQTIQPGQITGGQYGQTQLPTGQPGQVIGQAGLSPGQSGLLPGQVQPSTGQTIQPGQITGGQYGQTQLPTGQLGQIPGQVGILPSQFGQGSPTGLGQVSGVLPGQLSYPQGQAFGSGQPGIYGQIPPGQYTGPASSFLDPRFQANRTDLTSPDEDEFSQAETAVQQVGKDVSASASSKGRYAGGSAQAQVSGSNSGDGSFSAQAGTTDEKKGAQSQVSGDKDGALSSASGKGGPGQSESQVQYQVATGETSSSAQTQRGGVATNAQVQAGLKGGQADAQAGGVGNSTAQAQITFLPKGEELAGRGAMASSQTRFGVGQSQTQVQGALNSGISFVGSAQSGSGVGSLKPLPPFQWQTNRTSAPVASDQKPSASAPNKSQTKIIPGKVVSFPPKNHDDEDYSYEDDDDAAPSAKSALQPQRKGLGRLESLAKPVIRPGLPRGMVMQPGQAIPGSPGVRVPNGFRARVSNGNSRGFQYNPTGSNTYQFTSQTSGRAIYHGALKLEEHKYARPSGYVRA